MAFDDYKEPIQQELGLKITDKEDFATFEAGSDASAVTLLRDAVKKAVNEFYFVLGPHGCGKTHLLKALFQENSENSGKCLLLDLKLAKTLGPMLLEVPLPEIILLDNVDETAGEPDFELALFALFNRWYDRRYGTLVMTSSSSFDNIGFIKPDLNTRLSSGVTLSLEYLNEAECVSALSKRAKNRYLNLNKDTIAFLVRHLNRDMPSLIKLLDELEKAQIELKHELTIPFVKKILNIS